MYWNTACIVSSKLTVLAHSSALWYVTVLICWLSWLWSGRARLLLNSQISINVINKQIQCKSSNFIKLRSLFAARLFWTFHNKLHNMKALVILSHHDHHFSHLLVFMKKMNFCGSLWALLDYFREKKTPHSSLFQHRGSYREMCPMQHRITLREQEHIFVPTVHIVAGGGYSHTWAWQGGSVVIFNPIVSLFYTSTRSDWRPFSVEKNRFVSITFSSRDTWTYVGLFFHTKMYYF